MATESVPALQGDGLHKHLKTNGAAELFSKQFLLNLTDESRVRAVAVGGPVRPLVHGAVDSCVDRRVRVRASLLTLNLFEFAVCTALYETSLVILLLRTQRHRAKLIAVLFIEDVAVLLAVVQRRNTQDGLGIVLEHHGALQLVGA